MASHIYIYFFFSNTHAALLIKLCTLLNPVQYCANVLEGSDGRRIRTRENKRRRWIKIFHSRRVRTYPGAISLEFEIDAKRLARVFPKASFFRRESSNFFSLAFLLHSFLLSLPPPLLLAYVPPLLLLLFFPSPSPSFFHLQPARLSKGTGRVPRSPLGHVWNRSREMLAPVRSPHKSFLFEIGKWVGCTRVAPTFAPRNLGALRVEWLPRVKCVSLYCAPAAKSASAVSFILAPLPADSPTTFDPTKHGVEATIFLAPLTSFHFSAAKSLRWPVGCQSIMRMRFAYSSLFSLFIEFCLLEILSFFFLLDK